MSSAHQLIGTTVTPPAIVESVTHSAGEIAFNVACNLFAALVYSAVVFYLITYVPRRYHPANHQLRRIYERQIQRTFGISSGSSKRVVNNPDVLRLITRPLFDPVAEAKLLWELLQHECGAGRLRPDFGVNVLAVFRNVANEMADTTFHRDRAVQMLMELRKDDIVQRIEAI